MLLAGLRDLPGRISPTDPVHQIRTLNDFSHFVDGVDKGSGVREKSKQLGGALCLFVAMRQQGVVPNLISYNALISACENG